MGLDLLIIAPGNHRAIYQDLSKEYAALEPPLWAGLLANGVRKVGHSVLILDQEALGLDPIKVSDEVRQLNPKLCAIVVYGQQPSASTQNMTGALAISHAVKDTSDVPVVLAGLHPSALPALTLEQSRADFVAQGEGLDTFLALLKLDGRRDKTALEKVPGLWFWDGEVAAKAIPSPLIEEKDLSTRLPGVAWDLLPMERYRAHNWHAFANNNVRSPYASLYTSLGCPFKCSFCCINAPFGRSTLRCWDPHFIANEIEHLVKHYGVSNLKISDEMFVLNEAHVVTLSKILAERDYGLNIWAYARVDTVKEQFLEHLRNAGVKWLCLGIESGSRFVRHGVAKGRFSEDDVYKTVRRIQDAGIHIIANFIFGMPDDNYESMQCTLDMAVALNCEWANFYCAMAYPGSPLYEMAKKENWAMPPAWHDFSQHSFEMLPLPTKHLAAGEVISFRDKAWELYFTNPTYLAMIDRTFGGETVRHIQRLSEIKLKRKYAAEIKSQPTLLAQSQEIPLWKNEPTTPSPLLTT